MDPGAFSGVTSPAAGGAGQGFSPGSDFGSTFAGSETIAGGVGPFGGSTLTGPGLGTGFGPFDNPPTGTLASDLGINDIGSPITPTPVATVPGSQAPGAGTIAADFGLGPGPAPTGTPAPPAAPGPVADTGAPGDEPPGFPGGPIGAGGPPSVLPGGTAFGDPSFFPGGVTPTQGDPGTDVGGLAGTTGTDTGGGGGGGGGGPTPTDTGGNIPPPPPGTTGGNTGTGTQNPPPTNTPPGTTGTAGDMNTFGGTAGPEGGVTLADGTVVPEPQVNNAVGALMNATGGQQPTPDQVQGVLTAQNNVLIPLLQELGIDPSSPQGQALMQQLTRWGLGTLARDNGAPATPGAGVTGVPLTGGEPGVNLLGVGGANLTGVGNPNPEPFFGPLPPGLIGGDLITGTPVNPLSRFSE